MGIKIRFFCWLGVTVLLLLGLFRSFYLGIHLNTNVMDLLPKSEQSPAVNTAINSFSSTMGKQLIFLIGNPNKTVAEAAADQFYQQISKTPLLQNITYHITDNEQQAWGAFYFPYRLSLLTLAQKNLLLQNKIKQIHQTARFDLYNPMGIINSALLENDPWFLFQHYLMSLPNPARNLSLHDQRMMVHTKDNWYVMLNANLRDDSFSIAKQNKVINLIQASKAKLLNNFAHTKILMSGMLFYAKAGSDEAQHNISTIAIGSLIGIALLILLTFRSLTPLIYTLLSALVGFIAAFVVTQYIFGTVYLFTLVLGASLIGICVDYAFFYYADQLLGDAKWNAIQGLKNIFPGISLGLVNIILVFIILSITPFPVIKQLAVFAITGLFMAYATVICVFPLILKAKPYTFTPPLLRLTNKYLALRHKISAKQVIIIYTVIVIFAALGIYRLKPNDDIHILESTPAYLIHAESQIKQIIGSDLGIDFYVITGDTPVHTLENERRLTQAIATTFPKLANNYLAINSYIPSVEEQQQNFQLTKTKLLNDSLMQYLEGLGINKTKATQIQQNLAKIKFKPLTIDAWLQSPVSKAMRFLWLGKIDNKYASIVLLSNRLNPAQLKHLAQEFSFATYVTKADEISQIFKTYREKISILLIFAYMALLLLLIIRYSIKKAFYYFLPPVGACALSLGILGWLDLPLTLFNVLALILILGIAVDYILFFAETRSNYQSTMLATSLSAIATILSFGLLALSSTPVIHYFGITVLIGISSAFLLAPLVI